MELVVKGRKNKIKKSEWGKNKERDKLGSEIKRKSRFEKNQLWKKKKKNEYAQRACCSHLHPRVRFLCEGKYILLPISFKRRESLLFIIMKNILFQTSGHKPLGEMK